MTDQQKYRFPGEHIDVDWDERLCIHIAECGKSEGELFVGGRQPWCDPNLALVEYVRDVVERCPSGALTYQVKDGHSSERAATENTITVSCNGPYFVKGNLKIEDIPADIPGAAFRTALCRCGQSRNKPFCDNSHESAGFKDYGAIGKTGSPTGETGGELNIKQLKDGPLLVDGNVTLVTGNGRKAWHGNNVALCRCGASRNKPFCDGSHQEAGFKST